VTAGTEIAMDLNELQSARDRERQTDQLQQLRASFYEDAGEFIQQLRTERERAAERADDPFSSPEVSRLTDEIDTAEQIVEAIYENRIGKIVKAASLDAAGLPAEAEGLTAEEQALFETLVDDIEDHRARVLDVLDGTPNAAGPSGASGPDEQADAAGTESTTDDRTAEQPSPEEMAAGPDEGVAASDVMGGGRTDGGPSGGDTTETRGVPAATEGPDTRESEPPVRNDGGGSEESAGGGDPADPETLDRETVLVTDDLDTFVGFDDRDYDLAADDVVTLPATNAEILVERNAARRID
jgi:DNA replication factor GINS